MRKDGRHNYEASSLWELPPADRRNMALLVLLYFLQGVPFGLISGSLPFLFKPYLSYSQVRACVRVCGCGLRWIMRAWCRGWRTRELFATMQLVGVVCGCGLGWLLRAWCRRRRTW